LKDRITLEGERHYNEYSEKERRVLAAIEILLNYAEISNELSLNIKDLQLVSQYIVSYFKQFLFIEN